MELSRNQLGFKLVLSRSGALTCVNEHRAWIGNALEYETVRALRSGARLRPRHRTRLRPCLLEPNSRRSRDRAYSLDDGPSRSGWRGFVRRRFCDLQPAHAKAVVHITRCMERRRGTRAAAFLLDAPPSAHYACSRIIVLEGRQADQKNDHPGESRDTDDGNDEQAGTDYSVLLQELGASGTELLLPFGPIAIFEFHGAPLRGHF